MRPGCRLLAFMLLLLIGGSAPAETQELSRPLFDRVSLQGWRITDFHPPGEVQVRDGRIVLSAGEPLTGITYAGAFPQGDYEVMVEARRVEGNDFFATITFPVGDEFCSLVVGGWGGQVVGISSLEGADASENETARWQSFQLGRWYRIRLRVAEQRIQAWIDEERVVDIPHSGRLLSTRVEVLPSRPFGIASWNTTSEIRRVELKPLSGRHPPAAPQN